MKILKEIHFAGFKVFQLLRDQTIHNLIAEQVKDEVQITEMRQEKARVDAETDKIKTTGLTKEALQQQWIEAIRNSRNRIIITDGRTPIMVQ